MPRRSSLNDADETEIDLSPMIDCIFILLIFFIVTTVFVEEQGIQVDKPDAAATTPLEESDNIAIEISPDNKLSFDRREIHLSEIASAVRERVGDGETPVTIRVHEQSAHGLFAQVWDEARRGGAEALSFQTTH